MIRFEVGCAKSWFVRNETMLMLSVANLITKQRPFFCCLFAVVDFLFCFENTAHISSVSFSQNKTHIHTLFLLSSSTRASVLPLAARIAVESSPKLKIFDWSF